MKFTARLYKVNKGKSVQCAYFSTIKQEIVNRLAVKEGDALILEISGCNFPTRIRKLKTRQNDFQLGFTVPARIGKLLSPKTNHQFILLKRNIQKRNFQSNYSQINLLKLIPQKSIRNFPIFLFEDDNKLFVWIYSKGNKIATLPKDIWLSTDKFDLLELAGAFFCEGFKSRKATKHRDRFSFSNANKKQIEWFVVATEKLLGIRKEEWFVQILFPRDDLDSINKMKDYWSSFGLVKDKIKLVKNTKTNDKCGVCILNIYNSSLAESFYYIAQECRRKSLESKKNAIQFFRGLSRGDLGIGKSQNQTVTFSTESKENALFFLNLCKVIGISTNKPLQDKRGNGVCWNVKITHYENFRKLIEFGCITHHSRKINLHNKFLVAKKNHHFKYLRAINDGYNSYRKLINHMGIAESTSGASLIRYLRRGLLIRKRERHYVYELSEKGRAELDFFQDLNKWLTEEDRKKLLNI